MNKIIEIKPYKSKFKIRFDSHTEVLLYQKDIKRFHIYEGKEISVEESDEIYELLYKRAKERALFILDNAYKTEKQIRNKLIEGYYPSDIIERVIVFLKEYNMLDDYRYACMYIESGMMTKSRRRIVQDLYLKGISKELTERAFLEMNYSEAQSIQYLIEKKKSKYDLSDSKGIQKLFMYLSSKGYRYDDIKEALSNIVDLYE